ncbi:MAG TPA: PP2C family protein-serine/threonine phosphatase [Thermoanaerobaculia bacterium]|nr:PP2C family protein-serine/threonine phosphatase [Thermoanaerobaculia bacterium]
MSTMPTGGGVRESGQFRLFPRPRVSPRSVDVHAISIPAGEFTGDFYFSHRAGELLWLVVGDVAGKGLHASVVMAMIQEELEHRITACATSGCDPATTMQRLDTFLRPLLPDNRFASMVIAQLHDDGTLRIANAGHPPPLIARGDGSIQQVGSTGPIAGLLPSPQWHSVTMHLGRGESVLLYSDGVVEANDGSDEYGLTRLAREFASVAKSSARVIASSVSEAVRQHAASRGDDVTVLAAKR